MNFIGKLFHFILYSFKAAFTRGDNIPVPVKIPTTLALTIIATFQAITPAESHGFISSPRSRNFVAYQDRKYYPLTEDDPLPEDCPNCLNHGGTLARCGVMSSGLGGALERNYDLPKNALGGPMKSNPQGTYTESSTITIEITLTAHHTGHFTFKACPISSTTEVPSQECFDSHPLTFLSDEFYGAVPDPNFPERVYVAPETIATKVKSSEEGFQDGMLFRFNLQLPEGLVGDLVLIQWYYVASNSGCIHEGYDGYEWPENWIESSVAGDDGPSIWDEKMAFGLGNKPCAEILSPDGDGIPEQFWNCAEVTIVPKTESESLGMLHLTAEAAPKKTIIGYYASWQWYDREKLASPENIDFSKYTRVNFAFFQTDVEGNLFGTDSWADPNLLFGPYNWNPAEGDREYCSWDTPTNKVCKTHFFEQGLIHLAHEAGAEIYPSIGGWSLSDPFPAMAANAVSRLNFANKCIELVEEMGFDGIDIDWEYPGYAEHSGTPEDTLSYNLLLELLRRKLDDLGARKGKFYGLTAALPCGSNIKNIDIQTASKYLTELNLMTYDFFGAWSPVTGANSPLYDQDWGSEDVKYYSIDGCVNNWITGGGTPSAINMGLPFYGRSFLKAKGLNEPHEGNDKNTWFWDDGSPQYFNILEKLPELISVRHEPTKTQYAYKDTSMGGLVSYDDEQSICDKTEYCLNHNLNGFIVWEISGDLMADLSTPLIDAVHSKLNDPSLDCQSLAYDPNATKLSPINDSNLDSQGTPIPAPTTPEPTTPLICPPQHTGPLPHNLCKEYYYCVNGLPYYPTIPCPESTIYDEKSMLCLPAAGVTCSQSPSPTHPPTQQPSNVAVEPTAHQPSLYSPPTETSSQLICPEDFTGPRSFNECKEFYFCMQGTSHYPTIRCRPGTLFDEVQLTCLDASDASCALLDESLSSVSENLPSSSPFGAANEFVDSFGSSHNETTENDGSGYDSNGIDMLNNESIDEVVIEATNTKNDNDGKGSNVTAEGSNLVGSNLNIDDLNADETDVENSGGSNSANDGGNGDTLETSSIQNHETPALGETAGIENSHITVVMKLGSYPQDIGWSLLSFDGSINIAKPPGTYNSMKTNATVYETVSIPPQLFWNTLLLTLTISSIRGRGLSSGYYKVFSGVSDEGILLADGTEFEHYKAINLFISVEGVIQAVDDDPDNIDTDLENENSTPPDREKDEQNQYTFSTDTQTADEPMINNSMALDAENKEQSPILSSSMSQNNIADQVSSNDTITTATETNAPATTTSQNNQNTGLTQDTTDSAHGPPPSSPAYQVNNNTFQESITNSNEQSAFGPSLYVMDTSEQLEFDETEENNKGPSIVLIILISFLIAAFTTGMAFFYRAYTKKMPILDQGVLRNHAYDSDEKNKSFGDHTDSWNGVLEADMAAGADNHSYDAENPSRVYTQVDENYGRNNCGSPAEQIYHPSQPHVADSGYHFNRDNVTAQQNYDHFTEGRRSRSESPRPNGGSRSRSGLSPSKSPAPNVHSRSNSPVNRETNGSESCASNGKRLTASPSKYCDCGYPSKLASATIAERNRSVRFSQSRISATPYHQQLEILPPIPPNDAESTTGVLSLFETLSEKERENGLIRYSNRGLVYGGRMSADVSIYEESIADSATFT